MTEAMREMLRAAFAAAHRAEAAQREEWGRRPGLTEGEAFAAFLAEA